MHTYIHHSVTHYEHTTSKYGSRTSDQFILLVLEKKRKTVNANLIKSVKERGRGREGGGSPSQAVGRTGRSSMGV